ncbi:MAG TPA: terminase gpA endonuclease subunit, partial [Gemmata sp.]|nr:terminase gpA endonuclease subunit [Gemmata sp.]
TLRTGVSEWRPRPGERAGPHWRLTTSVTERGRMVQFDPDAWKTWLWEMLTCEPGGRGYLSFYGSDSRVHEMISEHVAAESAEPVTIRGNSFDKWAVLPHNPDNDWLDTLVGCAVAASVQGLAWDSGAAAGDPAKPRERPKTVSYREMQQKARAGR